MKKSVLILFWCLICASLSAYSQAFTPGNIVVYRYGDGTTTTAGVVVPVYLDEFTPAGVLVKTRAIPTITKSDGSGNLNRRLTGLGKLASGLYQQEGMSTLSQDGKYLTIFGYNQEVGGGVTTTDSSLVVGIVAADGSYNSTTLLSNAPFANNSNSLGAPRSAVSNLNNGSLDIYANGFAGSGVQYTTLGSNSSSRVNTASVQNSPRTMGIFNNTLYVPIGGSATLAYTTPPPTSTTALSTVTYPAIITTNQVAVFTVGTRTMLYVADDAANTIRRYYLNTAGTSWVVLGTTIVSSPTTDFLKGISGISTIVGSTTVIKLYATTWGNNGSGTEPSKLLAFTDTYDTANPINVPATTALTVLATAPANSTFRSVSPVPVGSSGIGTVTLPIKLSSFNGKRQADGIELSWSTASETNNASFDILRSADGKSFKSIGTTKGNGNSLSKQVYSFFDRNATVGTNYYQLNQIDLNGSSSKSEIIAVISGFKKTELNVSPSADGTSINASIYSANAKTGSLKIFSLSGRKLLAIPVSLDSGSSQINVPVKLNRGLYLLTLTTDKELITKKFLIK